MQTMMVFHSQQNTFYVFIGIYKHVRIAQLVSLYEKSDGATS